MSAFSAVIRLFYERRKDQDLYKSRNNFHRLLKNFRPSNAQYEATTLIFHKFNLLIRRKLYAKEQKNSRKTLTNPT